MRLHWMYHDEKCTKKNAVETVKYVYQFSQYDDNLLSPQNMIVIAIQ